MVTPVPEDVVEEAVELARSCGRLTLRLFATRDLDVDRKPDGTPVTEADRAAERHFRSVLAERHPQDAVVGEEFPDSDGRSGRRWTIDPIDGTKAFTRGVPLYSTLVALDDEHGPAVGVIDLPALGETVFAGRGVGAWWDDRPAQVSAVSALADAYVMSSSYSHWDEEALLAVKRSGAHLRTWGDGYGYALVATGRAEVMVDPEAARWDLAPMPVILAEAGGSFSDRAGRPTADGGSGVATNGALHEAVLKLLTPTGAATDESTASRMPAPHSG